MKKFITQYADRLGITSSVLCLIHCLVLPLVAGIWFEIGHHHHHHHAGSGHDHDLLLHGIDYAFIPLSAIAVVFAVRHTHLPAIRISLLAFMALFVSGILLAETNAAFEHLTHVGSAGLVLTHLINLKVCRSCQTKTGETACVHTPSAA